MPTPVAIVSRFAASGFTPIVLSLAMACASTPVDPDSSSAGQGTTGTGDTDASDPTPDDPPDTGDDPSDTGDDPTDTGDDPTDTGDDPSDTGDDPSDTGDDPSDTGDDPDFEELHADLDRELDPDATAEELAEMRAGNVDLGFDLMRRIAMTKDGNLAVSAISVRAAFGMVHAMAKGTTQTEIADTMGFLPDAGRTHNALNYLDLALNARNLPETEDEDPVIFATANRMFIKPSAVVGETFLNTLALNYGAGVYLADFAADADGVGSKINAWVSDRTRERIPMLFPAGAIKPVTAWVLVNAVYLKAPWAAQFAKESTVDRPFTKLDDSVLETPTMHNNELYGEYADGDGYQLVDLVLRGEDLTVTFILPDAGNYAAIEASLNTASLDEMLAATQSGALEVYLPKFTVKTGSMPLTSELIAMGMNTPFGSADFSGISDDGSSTLAAISFVYHSVFVAVDEVGVEAAAATGVGGDDSEPSPEFMFDANRPFLFLIRDQPTGLVLFTGRVLDPT